MQNYEGGFKIQNRYTYIDASVYDKKFKGLLNTPVNIQNQPIGPPEIYGSTAKGVRLVGSVNPLRGQRCASRSRPSRSWSMPIT